MPWVLRVLLSGMSLAVFGPSQTTQPATQPTTQASNSSPAISVSIWFPTLAWRLDIQPNGSASIQYGSTLFDSAYLPKGTLDFKAVVAEVERQQSNGSIGSATCGILIKADSKLNEGRCLKDDRYFRNLIESVKDKWQGKGWRFDELRAKYPIYPSLSATKRLGQQAAPGVIHGSSFENSAAAEAVRPILDAIDHQHDSFLKHYRAVVLVVNPERSMPVDALDIIWRDGEKVREDHHLPGVELQGHPAPLFPKSRTPEDLVAWGAQREPVAKELIDGKQEYVWFAGSDKTPRPRVQILAFREFPHLVPDSSWPDAIQWPTRHYSPADFHWLDANAETPAGCIGLRIGGEGNNRTDFYVDPSHDYICSKHIEWTKRGGKWGKSRVFTLSDLHRIDGHIMAGTQRVRSYYYDDAGPRTIPRIVNGVVTIDVVPLTASKYPAGVFDPASLTTGADVIDH